MGISHISKTTGSILTEFSILYVHEKKVACNMISTFYDCNRGNLILAPCMQHGKHCSSMSTC